MKTVCFKINRYNRNSIASLLGYIPTRQLRSWRKSLITSLADMVSPPSLLCYSFASAQKDLVYREVNKVKRQWPDIRIIAGGPHPSAKPQEALEAGFNTVFTGESEQTFYSFLKDGALKKGIIIPDSKLSFSLDDIDTFLPDNGLKPPLEITRGCFYGCCYCQTPKHFKGRIRHRSLQSAVTWFEKMKKTTTARIRFISPDAFSYGACDPGKPDPEAIRELIQAASSIIRRPVFFGTFPSEVRPENCTDRIVGYVKKYCMNRKLAVGAQSGSDRMLKKLRRGHTGEQIVEAVKIIRKNKLIPSVDFIFGMPSENEDDRQLTRSLIKYLVDQYQAEIRTHRFMPLPGTAWEAEAPGQLHRKDITLFEELSLAGKLRGDWQPA